MDKKGFTLIELLIVVAIIGILAMIAIPTYIGQVKKAARTEAYTNLQNLRLLEEQHYAENGRYAPNPDGTANYQGTSAADNGIEDILKGFNPAGLDNAEQIDNLNYTYTVATTSSGISFTATATGKTGRRSAGDTCTIDQSNTRTGPCW